MNAIEAANPVDEGKLNQIAGYRKAANEVWALTSRYTTPKRIRELAMRFNLGDIDPFAY